MTPVDPIDAVEMAVGAAVDKAAETAKSRPKKQGFLRENLEAILVAVVLALIIRHFAMEAFVIPTGSMAPTLLGEHMTLTCPKCGFTFPVDLKYFVNDNCKFTGLHGFEECPNCGRDFTGPVTPEMAAGGHKILVNKYIYKFRNPRRWEVIVFKYPRDKKTNYIKRLIGLPGEKLEIKGGDVFIHKPGMPDGDYRIARKPRVIQEEMWQHVWDMRFPDASQDPAIPWETCAEEDNTWEITPTHFAVSPRGNESLLSFTRTITRSVEYKFGGSEFSMDDVRLSFTVKPRARSQKAPWGAETKGAILVRLNDEADSNVFTLSIPVSLDGKGKITLSRNGKEVATAPGAFFPDVEHRVALANADDEVYLVVDGSEIITFKYGVTDDDVGESDPSMGDDDALFGKPVMFGVKGAGAVFTEVALQRDVYYSSPNFYPESGESMDGYFCLGDNSDSSLDSRSWGCVSKRNLVGKAFMVFWPPGEIKIVK